MKNALVLGSPFAATLLLALPAAATTWYVSPTGTATCGCTSRDMPCDLATAASSAVAGDTVILMDGVYKTQLYIANSGTESAWITFKADECSTPIIEGPGVGPAEDNQDSGVSSTTATYIRLDGIVSRGWSTGFGNGWTGNKTQDSNGHWDIENCIGDMNGRTGFTFFSADGFTLKHSISAHNGSSTAHSWSSGVTLYASPGDLIEGNVSFENMDAEKHTDGSGFIADESSHGASFINNLAFFNAGSCLRLTKSNSIKFINNTCYHDARDSQDTGPTDPDELYFTNAPSDTVTITNISFMNNVLVAIGSGPGMKPVNYTPTSGWSNNVTATGSVNYFTGAEGNNADFTLAAGASDLIGKGASGTGVPTDDLGLDPKCIVKKTPTMIGMMAKGSWWQYSIDYDYIKSIGGVAKCFNPKSRSGTPDVGSYANGAVTTAMPNTCTPPTTGSGGMSSACTGGGGMGGLGAGGAATDGGGAGLGAGTAGSGVLTGGTAGVGAGGTINAAGGMSAAGGTTGVGTGGAGAVGGSSAPGAGGTSPGAGGTQQSTGTGGSTSTNGGTAPTAGSPSGMTPGAAGSAANDAAGCGCRTAPSGSGPLAGFGLLGLGLLALRRRRAAG